MGRLILVRLVHPENVVAVGALAYQRASVGRGLGSVRMGQLAELITLAAVGSVASGHSGGLWWRLGMGFWAKVG